MGLETAALAVSAVSSVAQYQAQGAAGKYNQAVQNRNAQIAEQEAKQIEQKKERDLYAFDKDFLQFEGKTQISFAKAGVAEGGTQQKIVAANLRNAELQRKTIEYNAQVAESKKLNEAEMFRIQGQVARQQARQAQFATVAGFGSSLLSASKYMSSPFGSPSTPSAGDRIYTDY